MKDHLKLYIEIAKECWRLLQHILIIVSFVAAGISAVNKEAVMAALFFIIGFGISNQLSLSDIEKLLKDKQDET